MSSPSETVVLVIGIGNLLRGDDSVGRIVARRLRERNIPRLQVLEQEGGTTGLMEAWAGADTVFVVDAISSKSRPGTILRLNATHQSLQRRIFRVQVTPLACPRQSNSRAY
jgi:hydrogenase maturation protease